MTNAQPTFAADITSDTKMRDVILLALAYRSYDLYSKAHTARQAHLHYIRHTTNGFTGVAKQMVDELERLIEACEEDNLEKLHSLIDNNLSATVQAFMLSAQVLGVNRQDMQTIAARGM